MCCFNGKEVDLPSSGKVAWKAFATRAYRLAPPYYTPTVRDGRPFNPYARAPRHKGAYWVNDTLPGTGNDAGFYVYWHRASTGRLSARSVVAKVRVRGRAVANRRGECLGCRAAEMKLIQLWVDGSVSGRERYELSRRYRVPVLRRKPSWT